MIRDTRDLLYTYKGETTLIAAVTGDFCLACTESVLDAVESERAPAVRIVGTSTDVRV